MEILHSSAKGSSSSCKDDKIAIWKHYVTKKSNKINISLLPKQVHHLHQGARYRAVSEGVFQNKKAKARTVNSEETQRSTNTPIYGHDTKSSGSYRGQKRSSKEKERKEHQHFYSHNINSSESKAG
jgi:hypothetical protein